MRGKARPAGLLVLLCAFVVMAVGASSASAEFGIAKWEALTCNANSDTPTEKGLGKAVAGKPPLPQDPEQCTASTSAKWYRQASGHPNFGITAFELNTLTGPGVTGFPDGFIKDNEVHLPEGLNVNPEATPCLHDRTGRTGRSRLQCLRNRDAGQSGRWVQLLHHRDRRAAMRRRRLHTGRVKVPVFNVEPFDGVPSMVAFPTDHRDRPTSSATSTRPIST